MRRYIIGGIVLTGLAFLVAGGMALAANAPASGSGKAPNLVMPQQTKPQPAQLQPSSAAATPSSIAGDIRDIRGPLHLPDPLLWLYYAAGVSLFMLGAAAAWRWFRRRKILRVKLAFEIAFEQLERAKAFMNPEMGDEFSVAVSNAVRTYIESRFDLRVTRHTTEEFMTLIAAEPSGGLDEYADLLHHFLENCDLAKFARYTLGLDQMKEMHRSAWDFVDKTRPRPEEKTADQDMERSGEDITAQSKILSLISSLWEKGLNLIPKKTTAHVGLNSTSAVVAGGR
ncbi:MAG: hypothetical protein JRI74_09480 [Deltaproteobacteria bacterium]|nr:hypothetical protein [Deltaproteobacteria bacterium]